MLVAEVVLTAVFLYIILGATDRRAPVGFAPIAIGLGLTLIHLISIPVSNTSVNPARSLATALFAGPDYLGQVWLFWVAPLVGAAIAGITYVLITGVDREHLDVTGDTREEHARLEDAVEDAEVVDAAAEDAQVGDAQVEDTQAQTRP